jgi:hypothetical protein
MNTDKFLPLFAVVLPTMIFCFTVAVSYYCGKESSKQEQTMIILKERIEYWRLKNAMAVVGIEDIVENGKNKVEIKWMEPLKWVKPLDRGNR